MSDAITTRELADRYRLNVKWIKSQAKAGKLPHLRVGRTLLFNPVAVGEALARMASLYPNAIAKPEAAHATA